MDVAKYPGLMRRKARYYLRVKVPADLTDALGRQGIWRSLKTGDYHEAVRRYFPARTELQEVFQQARRRRDANGRLPGDEARRLVATWFQETDRQTAHRDFALRGGDRRAALNEIERDLFELDEGAGGESVQATLDRVLTAAGWPARRHVVGSIKTRRMVADVDGADTTELRHLIERGLVTRSAGPLAPALLASWRLSG